MRLNREVLVQLDDVIKSYDYNKDPALDSFKKIETSLTEAMLKFGKDVNQYGERQLLPHLIRISEDGAKFMKILGFSNSACLNFKAAYRLSDIGKMHPRFTPNDWMGEQPTPEQKQRRRRHAALGKSVLKQEMDHHNISNAVMDHPHISFVIPALMQFHHYGLCHIPMGTVMQVACIVDTFDGDTLWRPHQPRARTAEEALDRMEGDKKYRGYFDKNLLRQYRVYKLDL